MANQFHFESQLITKRVTLSSLDIISAGLAFGNVRISFAYLLVI